jgi:2-methylcitrate dehydratase
MTMLESLAARATRALYEDLSPQAVEALKARILDALGCAIGALEGEPIAYLRRYLEEMGGRGTVTLIGGGATSPDRAALFNGALVRYLDFNDSYLAPGETCHPSDNLAPVLAAAEFAGASGRDLLVALAVAYQVQCRLCDVAPVRARGFDHATQGSFAAAAGVAKALELEEHRAANAIAIAGTAFNALRVTRTGTLSHWKGLAYPNTAFAATHAAFLAREGITGPPEVFEGNKGFMDAISGPFEIDWQEEDLERVRQTILKKYNAEIHSQSALEGILELREEAALEPSRIARVDLEAFDVAFNIIGGGEEGDKYTVERKEQADHSLPYMVAAALLDGGVGPAQYTPQRIAAGDVQALLRKVHVRPDEDLSARFPDEMPVRITVRLDDGSELSREKHDYEGFVTRPMSFDRVAEKMGALAAPFASPRLIGEIVATVRRLDEVRVHDLTALLARVGKEE